MNVTKVFKAILKEQKTGVDLFVGFFFLKPFRIIKREYYSQKMQKALRLAQVEAKRLGHQGIGQTDWWKWYLKYSERHSQSFL